MDLDTAIQGYFDTRKRLEKAWSHPVELGDIALKMSAYGTYIGDHLGDLKAAYEDQRATKYLSLIKGGMSASAAENQARSELAEVKGRIAKIELVHKNLWGLVSIIQSQLKVLGNERNNGGLST